MKKKFITFFTVCILLFLAYASVRERHLVHFFRQGSNAQAEIACNETLWQYNAEEEQVIKPCITLTGTVESTHAEADGDENIQLNPDSGYVHLLNVWNILGQWGDIAIEPICENPPSEKKFVKACTGYKSTITLPHVGDHISVTGSYGADKHGWVEIHPVTKIALIP